MNWRAFGFGAAVATVAAVIVIATIVVRDDSDEPTLGSPVTTEAARDDSSTQPAPDGPPGTIGAIEPLELDAERLLAEPCAALTPALLDLFGLANATRSDGDRTCIAGSGVAALELELKPETSDPFSAAAEFQVRYGEDVLPLEALSPLAFQVRQGDRTLVTVFSTGVSAWFLVPALDVDDPLAGALRDSLTSNGSDDGDR